MPGETHPALSARRFSYSKGNPYFAFAQRTSRGRDRKLKFPNLFGNMDAYRKQACKFDQNFSLLAQSVQYVSKPAGAQSWCLRAAGACGTCDAEVAMTEVLKHAP